jgi:hypothetical protein
MLDVRRRYGSDDEFFRRNNLLVVAQPRYNYDRLRVAGVADEGNDWDEET